MIFTIPIQPRGQKRARHGVVKMRNGKFSSRTYKDDEQESREQTLRFFLLQHRPGVPLDGPVLLGVRAYLPIPATWSKAKQAAALAGSIRPIVKPDLDNMVKHVKDVMNAIFWRDDKQVVGYLPGTGKYYSASPRWEIEVVEFKADAA